MARQKGIIKLKGTIGDITFYKSGGQHMARERGGIDATRIASDPAFQRTRENMAEFGRAGAAGRVLRTALRVILLKAADRYMVSRLGSRMIKVIQADMVSERGMRNVIDGEAELLKGFEFNVRGKLGTTLFAPYEATIDRVTGAIKVVFDPFVPINMINAPKGSTHFKIMSAGAEIDFESEVTVVQNSESAVLPWNSVATLALTQTNQVTAASTKPLFLALGVEFFQEVNGFMYPLKNGAFNPLSLVLVDGGV